LAQSVAGVRQYSQFIALMDNYDKVVENQQIAENSEGTISKQAEIYEQSWEAARKRVKASMESIYQDLLDDKFFISLADGFSTLINSLDAFIKGLGGLKGVLTGITAYFLANVSNKIEPAF
jgi:hypothetical protein